MIKLFSQLLNQISNLKNQETGSVTLSIVCVCCMFLCFSMMLVTMDDTDDYDAHQCTVSLI